MKKIIFGALVLSVMLLAACTTITRPVAATENPVGSKVGEATSSYIFWGNIRTNGDRSLSTAAANGGVQKIATVEQRIYRSAFGGFSRKITTIVTGE
jgi:hypothetical protein